MDISYNWLKEYVKFDLNPDEVASALTNIGLEVEHQDVVEEIPGGLAGVIVAEVVECEPHPNSDHLHVTKVNTGEGELLQVVCGAPNVAKGQKVMLATLNTKLVRDLKSAELNHSECFAQRMNWELVQTTPALWFSLQRLKLEHLQRITLTLSVIPFTLLV